MADRLRHVLRALNSPWAITADGFETVCSIIDRRAAGVRLSKLSVSSGYRHSSDVGEWWTVVSYDGDPVGR